MKGKSDCNAHYESFSHTCSFLSSFPTDKLDYVEYHAMLPSLSLKKNAAMPMIKGNHHFIAPMSYLHSSISQCHAALPFLEEECCHAHDKSAMLPSLSLKKNDAMPR
ncbi:hypothetical protein [Absidia glauca]|uniref:Uncharacterized protein n=1 Tax=Absidia glauca TaxID=4829 RepID=A0A168M318_ABSGL|nr:hypothetical protein [Absidia glauca]